MKPDTEGDYVADIVDRERAVPRSLPSGSVLRLYSMSPNSRYSVLGGLLCIAIICLLIVARLQHVPYANSSASTQGILMGLLLMLFCFAFPLFNLRRLRRAVRVGIYEIGTVAGLQSGVIGASSTPAGMQNGAIKASISYQVNGEERDGIIFLDRPWVGELKEGTRLRLLIDPEKRSILYVIGIAEQHAAFSQLSVGIGHLKK